MFKQASEGIDLRRAVELLHRAMGLEPEHRPFPWQKMLLERFLNGDLPAAVDIPTGLGKTAVMAIWLVARAMGAPLPRRLVYVVDRRAVVDQATEVAQELRALVDANPELRSGLRLGSRSLPISTLRGKFVDNKEWLVDPTCPSIVVGTVDMIGSRLLFEGYGTSRKMRPYHAGLLGSDVLLVLDEAHLVPPFQRLIETIANDVVAFGPRDNSAGKMIPPFRVLPLSATGRNSNGDVHELTSEDLGHEVVKKRLDAVKQIQLRPLSQWKERAKWLADCAWNLTAEGTEARRVVIFCHEPRVAEETLDHLRKLADGKPKEGLVKRVIAAELVVGGRRVYERQVAADWLRDHQFLANSKVAPALPSFLVATSAGEVGVDLDADHMVSDLVEWERMVQRLGRVNRTGGREAKVVVFYEEIPEPEAVKEFRKKPTQASDVDTETQTRNPSAFGDTTEAQETDAEHLDPAREPPKEDTGEPDKKAQKAFDEYEKATRELRGKFAVIQALPNIEQGWDGSPGSIWRLKIRAHDDKQLQAKIDAATTPEPLRPALTRALVDAWSMTSLKEHTGRPRIAPWLRGWENSDKPQTRVVWRRYLPIRDMGPRPTKKEIEAFFEAAPPQLSEVLETEPDQVLVWLKARMKQLSKAGTGSAKATSEDSLTRGESGLNANAVVAFVLANDGEFLKSFRFKELNLESMEKVDRVKRADELERLLFDATLVMDARIGGCKHGRLNGDEGTCGSTGDGPWPDDELATTVGFRVRRVRETSKFTSNSPGWQTRSRFATAVSDEGEESEWLLVEKWKEDATTEDDRSAGALQLLEDHQRLAEQQILRIAEDLELTEDVKRMLAAAARLHDEGKRSERWQRAFRAPRDGHYAKTPGPINVARLDGYRHEFGSLRIAAEDSELCALPHDLRDLALHLIAAHHGFARPVIRVDGCDDAPPSALQDRACEVALRFAKLQRRWGPWGLAWWESLLRAADQQASREINAAGTHAEDEPKQGEA